jgi:cytochrome P450
MQKEAHDTLGGYDKEKKSDTGFPRLSQAILNADLPHEERSQDRLAQDGFVAIAAGGDPPARTMTECTYYLLTNTIILKKLLQELDRLMPEVSVLAPMQNLEQSPYLNAVVKEAMRLQALSTARLTVVSPSEPLVYKDWIIGPGVSYLDCVVFHLMLILPVDTSRNVPT